MPYVRILTFSFIVVFIGLAIFFNPAQPYLQEQALGCAALLALLVFFMAATRDFFMQFVAVLFAAYYLQRLIVIYFFPKEFAYHRKIFPRPDTVTAGVVLMIFCVAATIAGWWIARVRVSLLASRPGGERLRTSRFSLAGYRITFERLFLWYSAIAVPCCSFKSCS